MKKILLLCLLLTPYAWGTTYYVDNTGGSDSNNGTSEGTAWEHIHKACSASVISAGDTVLIRSGTYDRYSEGGFFPSGPGFDAILYPKISGTQGSPIVYKGYPGEARPIIQGQWDYCDADSCISSANTISTSWITFDSLHFKRGFKFGVVTTGGTDGLTVKNCRFDSIGMYCAAGSNPGGVAIIDNSYGSVRRVTVHDNEFNCIKNSGVHVYSIDTMLVYNNTFTNCNAGIFLKGPVNVADPRTIYFRAYDNTITFDSATTFIDSSSDHGTKARYKGNSGIIVGTQGECRDIQVYNNTVRGDYLTSMFQGFSCYDNSSELYRQIYIYNNTFDCGGISLSGMEIAIWAKFSNATEHTLDSVEIFNNIYYLTGSALEFYGYGDCSTPGSGEAGSSFFTDYNVIVDTSGGTVYYWNDKNIGANNWTWAQYVANCPQGTCNDNGDTLSDTSDFFTDRGNGDYTIDASNPIYDYLDTAGRGGSWPTYIGAFDPSDAEPASPQYIKGVKTIRGVKRIGDANGTETDTQWAAVDRRVARRYVPAGAYPPACAQ